MAHLLTTPQFSLPFRVANGEVVCHEQDTAVDRVQNAIVVLRYRTGERTLIPDFGISDLAFTEGAINLADLMDRVRRWEPDVEAEEIKQFIDDKGNLTVEVTFGSARSTDA